MKINRNPIRTQSYFSQQSFASLPHFQFCICKKPRWRRQKLGVKTPTLRLLHCRSTFQTVKIHLFLELDVAHLISTGCFYQLSPINLFCGPLKCSKSNFNPVHVFLHFKSFYLVVLKLILASKLSELQQFENCG